MLFCSFIIQSWPYKKNKTWLTESRQQRDLAIFLSWLSPAIRFGRMPQSEKLKLKAEMVTGDRDVDDPRGADQKTLARQIYEAYLKNFNMNKAKARSILSGKTSTPVRYLRVTGWWVNGVAYVWTPLVNTSMKHPRRSKGSFAISTRILQKCYST